jgi:AraC family transcriptional regulator, transcriptional activator of pobA
MTEEFRNRLSLTTIGHNTVQGRWRTEAMRSHASPRLVLINRGQGRITVAGLTSGYGPNNLIYIPSGVMYGFEAGPTVFGQILAIPAAMASEWPEDSAHLRLKDVVAQKEIAGIFDALERELNSLKSGHARAAHYHLGLLAVSFSRQIDARPVDPADERTRTASARLVAAYTDLIERDFRQPMGVADYARALGVTPTHLTRCCRATCGRSALSLLNDRIIFEARTLLRDTTMAVQDIASGLGFSSPAYFTRSFQARAGVTPSTFRRQVRGTSGPTKSEPTNATSRSQM